MASELSKFIDDELLREGNTGERSQLLNGGTFNVEKPGSRQARSNVFSKRNIACVVILIVVTGAVGTAWFHKDKAASRIPGWNKSNKAVPELPKPTPGTGPNKKHSQLAGGLTHTSKTAIPAAVPAKAAKSVPKRKLPGAAKVPGKLPKFSRHQVPIPADPLIAALAEAPATSPSDELAPPSHLFAEPRVRGLLVRGLLQIPRRNRID